MKSKALDHEKDKWVEMSKIDHDLGQEKIEQL